MKNIIRKILLGTMISGLVIASPLSLRSVYAEDTRCNAAKTDTTGHSGHKYEINGDTITVSNSEEGQGKISNYCKFFWVIQNNTEIKKLVVSDSINEIGQEGGGSQTGAFEGCTGLEEVTIPSSVTKIGFGAFTGCTGLKRVNIGGTVTEISIGAFQDCSSLTEITIKINGKIVDKTFDGCTNLNKVTISGNKIDLDQTIFTQCHNIKTVTLIPTGTDPTITINSYIFYNSSVPTIIFGEESVEAGVKSAIKQLPASITEIVVPDSMYSNLIGDTELSDSHSKIKSQTTYTADHLDYNSEMGEVSAKEGADLGSVTTYYQVNGNWTTEKPVAVGTYDVGVCTTGSAAYSAIGTPSAPFTIDSWKYTICSVDFDANGHGSAPSSQTVVNGNIVSAPTAPTAEGYTFCGWYKEAECTNAWDFDSDTVTENTTLYAKWTANKYTNTLKYNANGGTGAPENKVVTVTYPNTQRVVTVLTTKPKRTGYSFKGWYTAKSDGSKVGSTYALGSNNKTSNQSATIYAQWNVNTYTITYKLNGGKNGKNPASYKVTTSDITLKNPTRTGYTFKGWYKDSKFTKKITVIKKGSTGNKTVYAKWEANKYTIKYNANGGKGSMKSKSMTYDKKAKLTKNSFSRKGYTFLGWSTDKKATKAKYKNQAEVKNLSSKSGGTVTLYAVWKKK